MLAGDQLHLLHVGGDAQVVVVRAAAGGVELFEVVVKLLHHIFQPALELGGVFEHATRFLHAGVDHFRNLLLPGAGAFNHAREVFELAVHHFVHAVHEAAGHLVNQAHLLLGIDVYKLLQALLDWFGHAGDDFLQPVGETAVEIMRHGLNQGGLFLLVDGDLGHRVYVEHAGIAAHGLSLIHI